MDEIANPVIFKIEALAFFGIWGFCAGEVFETLLVKLIDEFLEEPIIHEVFAELAHQQDFVSSHELLTHHESGPYLRRSAADS